MLEPPGSPSMDAHAAVGVQTTLVSEATASPQQLSLLSSMVSLAQAGKVGLVVKGVVGGKQRGFAYAAGLFQSDHQGETYSVAALRALAQPGGELTYTVVPLGTQTRIGIDRDEDGVLDFDEPGGNQCSPDCTGDGVLDISDFGCFVNKFISGHPYADCNGDTFLDTSDFGCFQNRFITGCP
jgi:hypothetical protein